MFVDTFIRRPILAGVMAAVIVLAGAICIPALPIAQFPQLAAPQVIVSTFYTGANAAVVETAVTQPLEQAINGVQGMQYMTSSSGNDGTCSITITFDETRDPDLAALGPGRVIGAVEHTAAVTDFFSDPAVSGPIYDLPRPFTQDNVRAWIETADAQRLQSAAC